MTSISKLISQLISFRDARDWSQFHNPKNLASSISIEAGELLEHFQWLKPDESKQYIKDHKKEVSSEMADVLNYLLIMAHDADIDLVDASIKKIEENNKKYPIEKSKGKSLKYNKL